jgi:medium-chain acyl-[acyl-carrier-protein] hydrolase
MKYSHEYLIHYYEIGQDRRLKPSVLVSYFEDIAIRHSSEAGFTISYYDEMNRGFMLLNWDIKVFEWPEFNSTIKIITEPTTFKRYLANREYFVKNAEGKILIEAKSVWVFADTQTRKPVTVPFEIFTGFDVSKDSYKNFDLLTNVRTVPKESVYTEIKIVNSDYDTNNHVNNIRYVEWAIDSLPKQWNNNHRINRINVNYKRELYTDEYVELVTQISELNNILITNHSFYTNNIEICNIEFEWQTIIQ